MRPVALITGGSSGIGAAFAEQLAEQGHDLILVARRRDRLQEVAQQLERSKGVVVDILVADLTSEEDIRRVEQRIATSSNLAGCRKIG